jgi:hypothetical protein
MQGTLPCNVESKNVAVAGRDGVFDRFASSGSVISLLQRLIDSSQFHRQIRVVRLSLYPHERVWDTFHSPLRTNGKTDDHIIIMLSYSSMGRNMITGTYMPISP